MNPIISKGKEFVHQDSFTDQKAANYTASLLKTHGYRYRIKKRSLNPHCIAGLGKGIFYAVYRSKK